MDQMKQVDRDRLNRITDTLIDTITSPEMMERMQKFRSGAAKGAGFDEAADILSLESLRAAGAKLPDDFRLTSRVFEDRERGIRYELRPDFDERRGRSGPLEWGACAGGGAATVCGCAGGSS